MASGHIQVDVWGDYVCPFCYLEVPVIEQLKVDLGRSANITWHPYELRPEPVPLLDPHGEYLLQTWTHSVLPLAQARGMELRMPPVQPRSRKAFEAAFHAREQGLFDHMHRAIYKAFFEDGKDISSIPVLVQVGISVGLDADGLQEALEKATYTRGVMQEEVVAGAYGVTAVPVLTVRRSADPLNTARALSGAVDYSRLRELVAAMLQHT
jgi:predicted DsbA family dithiol-disulfide isomerase